MNRFIEEIIILNSILNSLEEGILVADPELRIIFMNPKAETILKLNTDKHTGRVLWETDLAPEILLILTSKKTGYTHRLDVGGESILVKGLPFSDKTEAKGSIWIIQRTSDAPETDSLICKTTEQELNAIIESVSDGIYVTDGKGITLRVNSAFQQITGIKENDVKGLHVEDLIKMDVFRKSATVSVLAEKRQVSMVENLKIGKEVLLTGTPVFDNNNEIFRVVTTLRDIESLNELKKKLAVSQEKTKLYEKELFQLRLQQMDMENVVINSRQMHEAVQTAMRLGEVNSNVLISGESGVGKDIIARIIHKTGLGEDAPLITSNCGAIPESLIESELFGYEGGAFTGAKKEGSPGLFELARGGTLFLDEIGELPISFQSKFLRAIQEKEIRRVGGNKPIKLDFRLIAATNRDLEEMVSRKLFRSDLFYRLNVVPLNIPPLRERRESIVIFVYKFLEVYNRQFNRVVQISPEALQILEDYDWPGNVRELKNLIERLVVLVVGNVIEANDIPRYIRSVHSEETENQISLHGIMPLNRAIEELEYQLLTKTYKKYSSTRETAKILGISQSQVSRKLTKYNIYNGPEEN